MVLHKGQDTRRPTTVGLSDVNDRRRVSTIRVP
jgi:hypothetical protein